MAKKKTKPQAKSKASPKKKVAKPSKQPKEKFTRIEATIPIKRLPEDMEQRVSKIEEGTVIDHINASMVFKVIEVLKLDHHPNMVIIASNLSSKKMGAKSIIKVEKRFLTDNEVNKISVFAPDATVSIIKNYSVKSKHKVQLPEFVDNVIKCSNPSCISNHERVATKFLVSEKHPLKVTCGYCERPMSQGEIQVVESN